MYGMCLTLKFPLLLLYIHTPVTVKIIIPELYKDVVYAKQFLKIYHTFSVVCLLANIAHCPPDRICFRPQQYPLPNPISHYIDTAAITFYSKRYFLTTV